MSEDHISALMADLTGDIHDAAKALCAAMPDASAMEIAFLLRDRFPEVWEKNEMTLVGIALIEDSRPDG